MKLVTHERPDEAENCNRCNKLTMVLFDNMCPNCYKLPTCICEDCDNRVFTSEFNIEFEMCESCLDILGDQ